MEKREQRLDREDWLYLGGAVSASAGCGWWFPPAGLMCFGASLVLWPFVARLLGGRKE
jgi:hypothetical protein